MVKAYFYCLSVSEVMWNSLVVAVSYSKRRELGGYGYVVAG